jgi:hypothetical protein
VEVREIWLTDVKVVGVTNIHASDTDATKVLDRLDALVQDLAGVGLETYCQLDGVEPALGVLAVMEVSEQSLKIACQDITLTQQHTPAQHPDHDHRKSPSDAAQAPCYP